MAEFNAKFQSVYPFPGEGTKDHSKLEKLGYEESGHTGFAPQTALEALQAEIQALQQRASELGQYIDEVQSSLIAVEEGLTNAQYNANSAKQVADGNTNSELALTNAQNAQLYLYNYGEQKVTTVTPGNVHTEVEGDTTFDFDASTGISMAKEGGNSVEIKPSDQNDKPCLLLRDTGGDAKLQPDLLQMYREDGTPGIFMGADANSLELLQNVSTLQSTIQAAGGLELIANVHDASLEGMHINSNTGDLFISLGGQKYRMYFDQNGFLKGDPV